MFGKRNAERADVANRVLAGGAPANIVLVLLLVMLIGACVGLINGFVMAKFKVHPYIITLAMQMIVYGIYLTVSNSVQVGSFDSSYTTSFVTKPLFQIQTGVRPNGNFDGYHKGHQRIVEEAVKIAEQIYRSI